MAGATVKIAGAYTTNDQAFSVDGASIVTDATVDFPTDTLTELNIGTSGGGGSFLNGHIQRLVYWPVRLPNNILQAITT